MIYTIGFGGKYFVYADYVHGFYLLVGQYVPCAFQLVKDYFTTLKWDIPLLNIINKGGVISEKLILMR